MSLLNDASLVFIPSGYKEDKVYSVIPSNGAGDLDFVRGCDATRVNPQSLVENTPWNLFNDTEDFTFGTWSKVSTTVTANTTVAPNGAQTADTAVISSGGYIYYQLNYNATTGSSISMSIYSKTSTTNLLVFGGATPAGTDTEQILNVGNGWYRHIITRVFTTTASGIIQFVLGFSTPGTHIIWGAQLNVGTIKPYFPTTDRLNVPRLTYANSTCPSLLLEKQSTNLALYSEQFNNASWGKSECSISANQTTAPDGTLTADKLVENTNNTIHEVYSNSPIALTAGIAYTKTIYAKSAERTEISLNFVTGGYGQGASVVANLNNGTLGTITNYGGVSGSTATITSINNGWYRISLTITPVSNANFYVDFSPALNGNGFYQGNGTSGIYIWGAQLEASSYPTSYIPTTSTAVTRLADFCSKSSASSLIGQTEGTLFAEVLFQDQNGGGASGYFYVTDGVNFNNSVVIGREPSGAAAKYLFYINGNGSNVLYDITQNLLSGYNKIAIAYKSGNYAAYLNGNLVASGTSAFAFGNPLSKIGIGTNNGTIDQSGMATNSNFKQALLFKRRLTNTELANLTTL